MKNNKRKKTTTRLTCCHVEKNNQRLNNVKIMKEQRLKMNETMLKYPKQQWLVTVCQENDRSGG
jgi:hypothetical protein